MLALPEGVHRVVVDIGANIDPILPSEAQRGSMLTLAFEPITFDRIRPRPGLLHVVPSAVAATDGVATMRMYNKDNLQSSSLATHKGFGSMGERVVPMRSPACVRSRTLASPAWG